MKKIMFIYFMCFGTYLVNAQGIYFRVDGGYGFRLLPMIAENLNEDYYDYYKFDPSQNYTISENHSETGQSNKISFGKGTNLGGAVGYTLNKNIGFEIGVNYNFGSQYEIDYNFQQTLEDNYGDHINLLSNNSNTLKGSVLMIIPSIVLQMDKEKLNPYVRLGLIFGLPTLTSSQVADTTESDNSLNPKDNYMHTAKLEYKYSGGLELGFNGALGVTYKNELGIIFFVELNTYILSFYPTKEEATTYILNNKDNLSIISQSQKEIDFSNNYSYSVSSKNGINLPNSEPTNAALLKIPFNSIGINLGFKIDL